MYDIDELYRDEPGAEPEVSEADEKLLREIRERYDTCIEYWRPAREERRQDMKVICGDPWSAKERKAREDANRPVLNTDECGQYINQSINNIRQNKRAINVEPAGAGANDKTAEYRQARIRGIEYRCKADDVYETAFQQMLEGSYGFYRISRKWSSTDPDNWEQDIVITAIPNPDSVLYDPECKQPDWSDARYCFVLEPMSREQFRRQWPNARSTSYSTLEHDTAPSWVGEKTVLVCEYWRVDVETRKQTRISPRTGKRQTRTVECRHVTQYFTNGVEILERNEQPGEEIPIPSCIGLERYVSTGEGEGSKTERKIFSMVRLARDPQMMLAYLDSQEAECAGLIPKTPYVGYTGQFESDREHWEKATKVPYPYLMVDPIPDSANGQILPPPRREPFTADFQSFEVAKESARRAIMSAMGISPLPTAAMRSTEKSGVAIQRIMQEQALGSFHFVDNFERAIARGGRIIESWLAEYDEGEKDVLLCFDERDRRIARINTAKPVINPQTGEGEQYIVQEGEHDVTVSVGPSNQSQRDAAQDMLGALVQNLQNLPIAPPQAAQLLAKSIEMMNLGPIGDEMAEIIAPQDQNQLPPAAQAQMAQAQGQIQQMGAMMQQLQAENQQLIQQRDAKVIENQGRMAIEQFKAQADLALEDKKLEVQIAVAEVNTKAQNEKERMKFLDDIWKETHKHGHEVGLKAADMAHERIMAEHEHEAALEQQAAAMDQQRQTEQQSSPQGG